jgi:hypothetical protein
MKRHSRDTEDQGLIVMSTAGETSTIIGTLQR